jgi:SH3-like domain-containing protein
MFNKQEQPAAAQQPAKRAAELIDGADYQLTRQMYLFPGQEVTADVNGYLKIGETVRYLRSGEPLEDNGVMGNWVYVRGPKGAEGWLFSHYLKKAD